MAHEFICAECGRRIFAVCEEAPYPLCLHCISLPGWFDEPELVAMLDPGFSPAPAASPPTDLEFPPR